MKRNENGSLIVLLLPILSTIGGAYFLFIFWVSFQIEKLKYSFLFLFAVSNQIKRSTSQKESINHNASDQYRLTRYVLLQLSRNTSSIFRSVHSFVGKEERRITSSYLRRDFKSINTANWGHRKTASVVKLVL